MMFRFKQFSVDQTGCAMKISTDGVLLGALVKAEADSASILDIGTGTGVIGLMLAQRFAAAQITAVEIDETAAQTAARNFENSVYNERLKSYSMGFEQLFSQFPGKKYDLIVSNPPFYINSLESPGVKKALAKHARISFFSNLVSCVSKHLNSSGLCALILPLETAALIQDLASEHKLFVNKNINIRSFEDSVPHRQIIALTCTPGNNQAEDFVIYKERNIYTDQYRAALKDFFTIF